jgi:hypothetical protein
LTPAGPRDPVVTSFAAAAREHRVQEADVRRRLRCKHQQFRFGDLDDLKAHRVDGSARRVDDREMDPLSDPRFDLHRVARHLALSRHPGRDVVGVDRRIEHEFARSPKHASDADL